MDPKPHPFPYLDVTSSWTAESATMTPENTPSASYSQLRTPPPDPRIEDISYSEIEELPSPSCCWCCHC